MKKSITLLLLLTLIAVIGCAPQIGYNFKIVKPIENSQMAFSDKYISIAFALRETWYKGVEGMSQYDNFEGVSFILRNKTNEMMTIDWNKISFKDYTGSSGNAIMHTGIKYKDCSSFKNPTIIPPRGKLNDIITPCYAVNFSRYNPRWEVHMLPSPRKLPNVIFGFYMPIKIGDKEHNYEFDFRATTNK